MIGLMQMPNESRIALGKTARERIASQFSMDARADAWESLYRSVLDARS
jgi:hypothetical protein